MISRTVALGGYPPLEVTDSWGARMRTAGHALLIVSATFLYGCPAMPVLDRSGASTLASAGEAATSSLQQQANEVLAALDAMPVVLNITEILNCRDVGRSVADPNAGKRLQDDCIAGASKSSAPLDPVRKQIVEIVRKRAEAFQALNAAYVSFANLASYDAGAEAVAAVQTAVGKVNDLTQTMAAIPAVGVAIPAIQAGVTKVLGGAGAALAEEKQAELLSVASKDLRQAADTMVTALKAEEDAQAMRSLMGELEKQKNRLERASLEAGLSPPMSILAPFYSKNAPDIGLVATPSAYNERLAREASVAVLNGTTAGRVEKIYATYSAAVSALTALSAQHEKFEEKKSIDTAVVLSEVQHLRALLAK